MTDLIVPEGNPVVVNLLESKRCCFCGAAAAKRKQMWKFPDGNYVCIPCKTRFDVEKAEGAPYSTDIAALTKEK
jgi:hypothetical protein